MENTRQWLKRVVAEGRLDITIHRDKLIKYPNTFVASQMVDVMLETSFIVKRAQVSISPPGLLPCPFPTLLSARRACL